MNCESERFDPQIRMAALFPEEEEGVLRARGKARGYLGGVFLRQEAPSRPRHKVPLTLRTLLPGQGLRSVGIGAWRLSVAYVPCSDFSGLGREAGDRQYPPYSLPFIAPILVFNEFCS